jgi:outer membrane lipoprotein SlyB
MQNSTNSSSPDGLGANARTGKYVGGGAAVGAVLGALMGGGKGAAIGALIGGAGGAGAQVYTGRKKEIPPETELSFKTAQDLTMHPAATRSNASTKHRSTTTPPSQ